MSSKNTEHQTRLLICGFCGKPVCKDETGRYADCSGYDLRYSK